MTESNSGLWKGSLTFQFSGGEAPGPGAQYNSWAYVRARRASGSLRPWPRLLSGRDPSLASAGTDSRLCALILGRGLAASRIQDLRRRHEEP